MEGNQEALDGDWGFWETPEGTKGVACIQEVLQQVLAAQNERASASRRPCRGLLFPVSGHWRRYQAEHDRCAKATGDAYAQVKHSWRSCHTQEGSSDYLHPSGTRASCVHPNDGCPLPRVSRSGALGGDRPFSCLQHAGYGAIPNGSKTMRKSQEEHYGICCQQLLAASVRTQHKADDAKRLGLGGTKFVCLTY